METEKKDFDRKNVNRIKKMIIFFIVVMCVLPIFLCLYLFVKINNMEKKIDDLYNLTRQNTQYNKDAESLEESLSDESYYDVQKTNSGYQILTMSDEDISGDTSNDEQHKKRVYLTFDDGPSIYTEEILEVLRKNDVKATFFVVYYKEPYMWEEYSRIVEEGHTLAMHSYSHEYDKVYANAESFREDVDMIHDFLYEQTGVDCKYYRFPGGSSNTVSEVDIQDCIAYLNEKGYVYFDWNALSEDAVDHDASSYELVNRIMGYVRSNSGDSIVLMHDISVTHATVEGLQLLIDTLKEEGYEICPIDDNTPLIRHVTPEV